MPRVLFHFLIFRSYSRSKKLKRGHRHRPPRDACVGPARVARATPSPTSTALGHSSCLEETCGQNHLLPQPEHFHPIVTNTSRRDCKNQNQPNQSKPKGWWEGLPKQVLWPLLSPMCTLWIQLLSQSCVLFLGKEEQGKQNCHAVSLRAYFAARRTCCRRPLHSLRL